MMFYILYMVHLNIMIRIDTYDYILTKLTKLTNTIFPTAVLVGFQSRSGAGASRMQDTQNQNGTTEPWKILEEPFPLLGRKIGWICYAQAC